MEFVKVEREDNGVAILTVDRQDKLNSLNPQVIEEIHQALQGLEEDQPRVTIVTGAGERAFVAGADIAEMNKTSPLEAKRFAELGHRATALLDRSTVPSLAAVNGFALGGG